MGIKNLFESILNPNQILTDNESLNKYGQDWIKDYKPNPSLILFPKSLLDLKNIIKVAEVNNLKLVPSGGRTGLSGAATAIDKEIVVSFEKYSKILDYNPFTKSITIEPGVALDQLQSYLKEYNRYIPLSIPSSGSAQLGGILSTNCGGSDVFYNGNIRKWVLGIEFIDGTRKVYDSTKLIKERVGYDFDQLIIGSEGTLGFISKILLKTKEIVNNSNFYLLSFNDYDLFNLIINALKNVELELVEYLDKESFKLNKKININSNSEHYLLLKINNKYLNEVEEKLLYLIENSNLIDVITSKSTKQNEELLKIREDIPIILSDIYYLHKFDISFPFRTYLNNFEEIVLKIKSFFPMYKVFIFGHLGDANLHINIATEKCNNFQDFINDCHKINKSFFEYIKLIDGSISAEHGIGLKRKEYLQLQCSNHKIDKFKNIKKIFDPNNIINPGKIF